MCGYCIESGFVFDFWQHGHFNLPEPYRNDDGEIAIDFATACYALFEAPNPEQLSEPWLSAAQKHTPYWPLRQLEQALLALPLDPAEVLTDITPSDANLTVNPKNWPTVTALWQHWQQRPGVEPEQVMPAFINNKLLNEARACLHFTLQPFDNVQESIKNYIPDQDVFAANEEDSNQFYHYFAEAWLAFCLLRKFQPFDPLLISWSAVMPRHMPSFSGEDLVIIRQAFWHCLNYYGAPYFIEHGSYQRAELLAYAAKRFIRSESV